MAEKYDLKNEILQLLLRLTIERGIEIDKIIIFGSFVKGNHRRGSDIDIAIISRSFRDKSLFARVKMATGINRELVRKFQVPVDLLYYSDHEWQKGASPFVAEIKSYGEIII